MKEVKNISYSSLVIVPLVALSNEENVTIDLEQLREYKIKVASLFAQRLQRVNIIINSEEQDYFKNAYEYWVKTVKLSDGNIEYSLRDNVEVEDKDRLLSVISDDIKEVLMSNEALSSFSLKHSLRRRIRAC